MEEGWYTISQTTNFFFGIRVLTFQMEHNSIGRYETPSLHTAKWEASCRQPAVGRVWEVIQIVLLLKSTTSKWCCNQPNGSKPSAKGLARTLRKDGYVLLNQLNAWCVRWLAHVATYHVICYSISSFFMLLWAPVHSHTIKWPQEQGGTSGWLRWPRHLVLFCEFNYFCFLVGWV